MAFWKKSEDPWDVDLDKRRPTVREESAENNPDAVCPADAPQAGAEGSQAEENREAPAAPMRCPWCGGEMEVGYLIGGRDAVRLVRERPGALRLFEDPLYIRGDGTFWCNYKIAWTCPKCRKLVLDLPEPEETSYAEELRDYAQQANQHEGEN